MITHPLAQKFRFCPQCGAARPVRGPRGRFIECGGCGFLLHFNPGIGVGVLLSDHRGRLLLVRRGKAPAKGKLGVPGGFADAGENAEAALAREVREEVGVTLPADAFRYVGSAPNRYRYRGVTYAVLDFFYTARLPAGVVPRALDEVASWEWREPAGLRPEELAFASLRVMLVNNSG